MSEFLDALGTYGGQGLASVGANALNGLMNVGFNAWNTENQLSAQHKYWRKQFDIINEYNKPINQMSRFQEAGLNPNLIYGQSNVSTATPSNGTPYQGANSNTHLMGPLEYQQYKTSKENAQQAKFQSEIAEEQAKREKILTDEKLQQHITYMYNEQNNLRKAIALGGYYYNPFVTTGWQDRHGSAYFGDAPDAVWNVDGKTYGDKVSVGTLPVQYDSSLLSNYLLGELYHSNSMKEYNTHEKDEARINTENMRDMQNAHLEYDNVEDNWKLLKALYKQGAEQEFEYNNRTFEDMTQSAISGFKEAIAKNNLLALMHAGGYLGNESPLLRFFGKKIGHSGFDDLYSFPNYLKIKGDALWNAISQMGVDVAGAYLGRGAKKPFNSHTMKTGHHAWTDYK